MDLFFQVYGFSMRRRPAGSSGDPKLPPGGKSVNQEAGNGDSSDEEDLNTSKQVWHLNQILLCWFLSSRLLNPPSD